MASTDYDQNDNDYKANQGAAEVEREQAARQRAQEVAERMKMERARKAAEQEAAREAETARRAEARERVDEAIRKKKAEQARERAEQESRAKKERESEREREILKRQQEARELRERKKAEQIEQAKKEKTSKYQEAREARREKTERERKERVDRPAKVKRQQAAKESARKDQEDLAEKFKYSKAGIEKAAFEGAAERRREQELQDKADAPVNRPYGPGSKPSKAVEVTNRMFDVFSSGVANVKKHAKASYSDIFKVPFQPRENIGTAKEIKYSRQQNPYASAMFGSIAKPRGGTPRGLLSLGSFAGTPSSLFAVKNVKSVRRVSKKKRGGRTRSAPPRNTLDDMLFF